MAKRLTKISTSAPSQSRFVRYAEVEDDGADDSNRIIQIAFASEYPVERTATAADEKKGIAKRGETYLEVLSHDKNDADFSRLHAVLDEHNGQDQIGKVLRAEVSDDKKSRAVIQYDGVTNLSKTRYQQAVKRSRPFFSVGYDQTKFLGDSVMDGKTVKRFSWQATEVSSVHSPADENASAFRGTVIEKARCTRCGEEFSRDNLDDDYRCEDCGPVERALLERFTRASDGGTSAHHIAEHAQKSAMNDTRFTGKDNHGNTTGWVQVQDVKHDGDSWFVILYCGTDGKCYQTKVVEDDTGVVTLGDHHEVAHKSDWHDVNDMHPDGIPNERSTEAQFTRSDAKKPYGDVTYADPGYQADGTHRYPVDTKAHAKAAWSYINMPKNEKKYSAEDLAKVKGKIKAACKKFGVDVGDTRTDPEADLTRSVDSTILSNADELVKKLNTDTKMKLRTLLLDPKTDNSGGGGAALDEAKIRSEEAAKTRTLVVSEFNTTSEKVKLRNKEIVDLADAAVKTYGKRWNGKPGEVFVVGERIRSTQAELCSQPADRDAAELRKDFKRSLDTLIEGSREPKDQTEAATMPQEIAKRCSLMRVVRAGVRSAMKGNGVPHYMPTEGAEKESNDEIRNRAKDYPGGEDALGAGFILPINMPSMVRKTRSQMKRDSLAGDFASAGALISPEFIFPTIELLRNLAALTKAGITVLSGVMGNLVLPRQTAPTTAQSVAEGAALLEFDQTFDQIKMEPHRVGSNQKYSRLALLQDSEDFEALVMRDHLAQIALWIDEMGINGQGAADQPLGILQQPGIGVVSFLGSAGSAYNNCVKLETAIRKANIYDDVSFISTSNARGTLRVTPETLTGSTVVSGATNSIWQTEGGEETCIGRTAVDSQQVPGDRLICLAGRHVILAQWGGLAVVLDTISQAASDKYVLSVNTYIDYALRHAQAIAVSADSVSSLN